MSAGFTAEGFPALLAVMTEANDKRIWPGFVTPLYHWVGGKRQTFSPNNGRDFRKLKSGRNDRSLQRDNLSIDGPAIQLVKS
jgi:hypothetical protein